MPQSRARPFSAKQKKEQLKAKRERKAASQADDEKRERPHSRHAGARVEEAEFAAACASSRADTATAAAAATVAPPEKRDAQRYRLLFMADSKDELERRRLRSMQPYELVPDADLEMEPSVFYPDGVAWEFPKRPQWNYSLTLDELERNEQKYFQRYLDGMFDAHSEGLSYFEMNLETWRQLWRVLEMSDVLLLIADARFASLHVPRFVCDYVIRELKKDVIIVLNKIDVVPACVVAAWESYLSERFPGVRVVSFTSYPRKLDEQVSVLNPHTGKVTMKKRRVRRAPAVGPVELWRTVQDLVRPAGLDLSGWRVKIEEDMRIDAPSWDDDDSGDEVQIESEVTEKLDLTYVNHGRFKDGVVTIGCIGYPNVGKSSLINGLMGKKVVSVSRTPGHTKHFQTIFLTESVRLCDCPGLVFPSCVPKQLQVLSGLFPIAQLREPYSAVQYLAERIPLPRLLGLEAAHGSVTSSREWSAFDICDAWAEKRGFMTAKTGRPDTYRSANNILQMALQGKLVLFLRPPGYAAAAEQWACSERAREIGAQQDEHKRLVAAASSNRRVSECSDDSDSHAHGGTVAAVTTEHMSDSSSENDRDDDEGAVARSSNMYDLLSGADND